MAYGTNDIGSGMMGTQAGTLKPPGPRIEQSVARLESSVKHAADLAGRMGGLADRICGSIPEAVEKEREPGNAASSVGRIEILCEALGLYMRRAESQLQRLETL